MAKQKDDGSYDGSQIQVLEGLDPVRKRPGMYIGSTGYDGVHHLIKEIADNSIDEAIAGHGTRVDVRILEDGGIMITDDRRGIPVDKHPKTGSAFDKNNIGRLIYNVDFGAKTGQGYVDGLTQYGRVTLNRGEIKEGRLRTVEIRDGGQVSGTATAAKGASLNYVMQFFGNQAEEVAGYAANKTHGIALHGTRGEITQ